MIKNILLLSIVLLFTLTVTLTDAQTPTVPYIVTDKPVYYHGDDIIYTIHLEPDTFGDPTMYVIGTLTQSTAMIGKTVQLDNQQTITITQPTYSLDDTQHSVMPNDGSFTAHIQYNTFDPIDGIGTKHITTTFLYFENNYDQTDRFEVIEGDVTRIDGEIVGLKQEDANIHENVFDTIQRISVNEDNILDLQNATGNEIPPELIARIDALETEVATIQPLKTTIADLQMQVTTLVADLTTLQSQQVPTNAELQTSISSNDNNIMMMGLDVSSIMNDVDNGIWPRVVDLQTDTTDMSRDITTLQGDVNDLQIEVTAIVTENATPQDVDQNLRMDGIESDLQIVNATLANDTNLLRTDYTQTKLDLYSKTNANKVNISNLFTANQTQSNQIDTIVMIQNDDADLINNLSGGISANQIEIINLQGDITGIETNVTTNFNDLGTLEQLMTGNVQRLELITDTHNTRIEIHAQDISDLDMITNRQGGEIQTLQTDLTNIQTASSPHDDTQNLRLSAVEADTRTNEMQIDGLSRVLQGFGVRIAGVEQSITGILDEIRQLWIDMSFKQNVLDAP